MNIDALILLVAAHFLGDFAFQSDWMIKLKGTSWEINGYHALTYAATLYVVAYLGNLGLPMWFFLGILLSHFLIDPLKAKYKVIKHIWLDQILHFSVIYLLFALSQRLL